MTSIWNVAHSSGVSAGLIFSVIAFLRLNGVPARIEELRGLATNLGHVLRHLLRGRRCCWLRHLTASLLRLLVRSLDVHERPHPRPQPPELVPHLPVRRRLKVGDPLLQGPDVLRVELRQDHRELGADFAVEGGQGFFQLTDSDGPLAGALAVTATVTRKRGSHPRTPLGVRLPHACLARSTPNSHPEYGDGSRR